MRELKFPDVFSVIRIIKKAGISRQVRAIFADSTEGTSQKEIGAKFLFSCVEKEVIEKMNLEETTELLMVFLEHPGLKSFLSSVSKLMK
jgi:hypothetical protein